MDKQILPDVFEIPIPDSSQNEVILYAPLKRVAVKADRARLARVLEMLCNAPDVAKPESLAPDFFPTTVTLDLIHQCSLRCVYCSIDSGSDSYHSPMAWNIAQAAVDFVINSAVARGTKEITLQFNGGGELTLAWKVLKGVVEYARAKGSALGLQVHVNLVTNGVLNEKQVKWIVENVSAICVSLDGPPEVQDIHRPLSNGRSSFEYVRRTLESLNRYGANFNIRPTVSELNLDMAELLHYLMRFGPQTVNFQPLTECGRCAKTGWSAPKAEDFTENFLRARDVALRQYSAICNFPGANLRRLFHNSCGGYGDGFTVTPQGLVSSCERVLTLNDPLSQYFIYGRYDDTKRKFELDLQKLYSLRKFTLENIPSCRECFCKWHCAGGCLNLHCITSNNDFVGPRRHDHCQIVRTIARRMLVEMIHSVDRQDLSKATLPL